MANTGRLKILLTAHEISPVVGSECSSGWNVITRLGAYHDVTVLFAEANQFGTNHYKEQIDAYVKENGSVPGITFIPVPQPAATRRITALNRALSDSKTSVGLSLLYFLGVRYWEKEVYRIAKQMISREKFDVIHHFNHLSFREPGYLWKLGLPFCWGPASGLSIVPLSFLKQLPKRELVYNLLRNFLNRFQVIMSSRIRRAIKKARLIYFVTADDEAFFAKRHNNISNMLDMGGYRNENHVINVSKEGRVKILWVGRFSFLKALNLLFYAVGQSEILRSQLEIHVIGDGPEKEYYKAIADELKLKHVFWIGHIPKNEVFKKMQESDCLVHSSIKEAASAVILESLSAGLPVICHDAFGMRYAITETSGIKVPFASPEESIAGFRAALEKICADRDLILTMKHGALQRANELTWDSMSKRIADDYRKIAE